MNSSEFWLDVVDSQVKTSVMQCSLIGKNNLVYDSQTKSYLINLNSTTLLIPKSSTSLKLTKPILIFLLHVFSDKPFTFEFVVADSEFVQRRIVFDSSKALISQFSYVKIPNKMILRDSWVYLSIDLSSIFQASFGENEFRYVESISVHGTMLIRKIVAAEVNFSEFTQSLCDMGKVQVKTQEISKHFVLKSNSNSPNKNIELKISPRGLKTKGLEKPNYSQLKAEEIRSVRKYEKSVFKTPLLVKFKKSEEFDEDYYQAIKKSKVVKSTNKYLISRITPSELEQEPESPNFFQQLSSGLLKIRHETPPFVGSRGNIFYNPVQKKYDSL